MNKYLPGEQSGEGPAVDTQCAEAQGHEAAWYMQRTTAVQY